MNNYATLKQVPSYFKMINNVETSGASKDDSSCQPSFDYFQKGTNKQVMWGSSKPMKEVCPQNYKPHTGNPTHSIWNNMTKRRSIVASN
tara:strand:- start:175 stop:441 length:267 start_codon:yes stop_codon:yes gene_type:complete